MEEEARRRGVAAGGRAGAGAAPLGGFVLIAASLAVVATSPGATWIGKRSRDGGEES